MQNMFKYISYKMYIIESFGWIRKTIQYENLCLGRTFAVCYLLLLRFLEIVSVGIIGSYAKDRFSFINSQSYDTYILYVL